MSSAVMTETYVDRLAIKQAALRAIAYADVFDYPLAPAEVHRYLVGVLAAPEEIDAALREGERALGWWACYRGYVTLPGREELVETRMRRAELAAKLWPKAVRYGQMLACLPFVRMVAVTGALAVDNVQPGADIDFLLVTEPGRLWLCRAMAIAVVRLAARDGAVVCPNYLISDRALALQEHTLYTAHELTQMVPIANLATYARMRRLNTWADRFLPNANGPPRQVAVDQPIQPRARGVAEAALRTPVGGWLERQEMARKVRKLRRQRGPGAEAAFCADWCKGHFEGHGQRTLEAFDRRLRDLGIAV